MAGAVIALLTGLIVTPLIDKLSPGLLGNNVDERTGLTVLIVAALLSGALYNFFLSGPIMIGAGLVSYISLSIIFELGPRLGDDNHYSLWLWPVVAVAYLWARRPQPGERA